MIEIIVALITGVCSVVAVVVTNIQANKRVEAQLEKQQAITDTKIEELTREVRMHNEFARRIPVIENEIEHIKKDKKEGK